MTANSRQRPALDAYLPLAVVLALAAVLRLWNLGGPALWWDEGLNAYLAHLAPKPLLTMSNAVLDSNPPVYRLLLGVWLRTVGDGAIALRLPSVLIGLATVVVVYLWGRWQAGARAGLLAATLMALNPMAIYRQREAKAYPLVALFAALSCYLWLRYVLTRERVAWPRWLAYSLCTALAIGSHYYALFLCAAQGVGLVVWLLVAHVPRREALGRLGRWALAQALAVGVWLPWVALSYHAAWGGAAEAGLGRASLGLWAYAQRMAFSLIAGPEARTWAAALAVVALAIAAFVALLPPRDKAHDAASAPAYTWPLAALIVVPLALGYVAQRVLSFMDPRYFFYVTPVLALLAAIGLLRLKRWALPVGLALVVAWGVAVPDAYAPYGTPQDDLRPIAEVVRQYVHADDAVVVAYIWQEGVLRMYVPEVSAHYELGWYAPEDVGPALEALFARHPRLWLVSFNVPLQDPANTAGWWLEQHATRIFQQANGNNHIAGYVRCPCPPPDAAQARFAEGTRLAYSPVQAQVASGEALCVPLAWTLDAPTSAGRSVFVHLADAQGVPWAQSDSAPQQGTRGFETFAAEETVCDPRALLITADIPPGDYRLLVGVYSRDDGQRLSVTDGPLPGVDSVEIGVVTVTGR